MFGWDEWALSYENIVGKLRKCWGMNRKERKSHMLSFIDLKLNHNIKHFDFDYFLPLPESPSLESLRPWIPLLKGRWTRDLLEFEG